jgi:hypothetical protein
MRRGAVLAGVRKFTTDHPIAKHVSVHEQLRRAEAAAAVIRPMQPIDVLQPVSRKPPIVSLAPDLDDGFVRFVG